MATKSKRSNPLGAFIAYFLCVTMVLLPLTLLWQTWHYNDNLVLDYKQTSMYRDLTPELISAAWTLASSLPWEENGLAQAPADPTEEEMQNAKAFLESNGTAITYFVSLAGGGNDGAMLSYNTAESSFSTYEDFYHQQLALSRQTRRWYAPRASHQGIDHLILIRDGNLVEGVNQRTGQMMTEMPLRSSLYSAYLAPGQLADMERCSGYQLGITITNENNLLPSNGTVYRAYYQWYWRIYTCIMLFLPVFVGLLGLLLLLLRRGDLRQAKTAIAAFTGKFWIELKLLCLLCVAWIVIDDWFRVLHEPFILLLPLFWILWLVVVDLRYNGKGVWRNNSIAWGKKFYFALESRYSFAKRLKRRYALFAGGAVLLGLTAFVLGCFGEAEGAVVGLVAGICGAGLLVLLGFTLYRAFEDMGKISDYAAAIRQGSAQEPLALSEDSDFAAAAEDLSQIHSGMAHMVEARISSEKMKVELITNVSHDLKTPLTSIITYVDLLDKERLSPEFANDYVDILAQKSQRLKNLVQDLFEISKANSGDAELHLEKLSVNALVEQTVAEMEELSGKNGLEVRLSLDADNPIVRADGRKLHRVLENLLGNSVKYALSGTRIYVDVRKEAEQVRIIFKNVSAYEMRFTAQEIIERFSRGDISRSTEGSGLGLAIAKSFLELNGGYLDIQLDGDLFKAAAVLPLYVPYAQQPRDAHEGYIVAAADTEWTVNPAVSEEANGHECSETADRQENGSTNGQNAPAETPSAEEGQAVV